MACLLENDVLFFAFPQSGPTRLSSFTNEYIAGTELILVDLLFLDKDLL